MADNITRGRFNASGSIATWLAERLGQDDPELSLCIAVVLTDAGTGRCWAHDAIDDILGEGIAQAIENYYIGQ